MEHIRAAADVDASWLTGRLRASGAVRDANVTSFTPIKVGNGLLAESVRFELSYDVDEPGAPRSVVGKFPAREETTRLAGVGLRLYEHEVKFYQHIAPTVRIATPRVLESGFHPTTHDFYLLFEDLSPARGGDQIAGCTPDEAAHAMREIAGLHGPRWNDPEILACDWLTSPPDEFERIVQSVIPIAGMFREHYGNVLEPEVIDAAMRTAALARPMLTMPEEHVTVVHGDFRLDNVLFDAKGGQSPFATLDWQTVGRGRGTIDASYFLGSALKPDERRAHERELIRLYHDTLLGYGVTGYSWDACWSDYRKHSINGLFMALFAVVSVAPSDRSDDMFATMARRHTEQAQDLDAFTLWPEATETIKAA